MNLLHISDIHFRKNYPQAENAYGQMLCRMENPIIPLEYALKHALSREPVDAVLLTGDLTEDGSPEDYRFLRKRLAAFCGGKPLFVTPGNHDSKKNLREGWLSEPPSQEPLHQVYDLGEYGVIAFDSSLQSSSNGQLDEARLRWLKETLRQEAGRPLIFMTHHHLLPGQAEVPALPGAEAVLRLLSESSVFLILTGHTHHQFEGRIGEAPYHTAACLSFCGESLRDGTVEFSETRGYNLYRLSGTRMLGRQTEIFSTGKVVGRIHKDRVYE